MLKKDEIKKSWVFIFISKYVIQNYLIYNIIALTTFKLKGEVAFTEINGKTPRRT